jgi:hypothetical protein
LSGGQYSNLKTTIMKKFLLLLPCLYAVIATQAQGRKKQGYITAAITNAHTAKPFGSFSALFSKEMHPGFEVGAGINWSSKPRHDWYQEFRFGYFYHHYVQHSLSFYTEFGYRFKLPWNMALEGGLGGGFTRVIVASEVFVDGLEKDRQYTHIVSGRTQAIVTTSFALNKAISKKNGSRMFFRYQQRVQTPFVQSYIPLLPYNIAMIGANFPLHSNNSKN